MRYDLVIFDLDGTILDTLDDLGDAVNHVLAEAGFPARTRDEVRRFIGNGVVNLIRRSAPQGISEDVERALLAGFRTRYAAHLNDRTRPYAGICELMSDLRGAGVHVAVNSNKPDAAVKALCRAHFGALVEIALGERAGHAQKARSRRGAADHGRAGGGAGPYALRGRRRRGHPHRRERRHGMRLGVLGLSPPRGARRADDPRAFDSPQALRAFLLEDA